MPKFNSDWIDRNVYYEQTHDEVEDCPHYTRYERPLVVCLIGSSRFKQQHEEVAAKLTREGKIVLPLCFYGHCMPGYDMEGPEKKLLLNTLHLRKIDCADEVFVVNPDGYMGEDTTREFQYSKAHGKTILSLEPLP